MLSSAYLVNFATIEAAQVDTVNSVHANLTVFLGLPKKKKLKNLMRD